MQVDTGHLVSGEAMQNMQKRIELMRREYEGPDKAEKIEALEERQKEIEKYVEVPAELNRAAKRKLAGKDEAYVSLTSGGKLSRWAAKQRKAKRKSAAQSRRKNR